MTRATLALLALATLLAPAFAGCVGEEAATGPTPAGPTAGTPPTTTPTAGPPRDPNYSEPPRPAPAVNCDVTPPTPDAPTRRAIDATFEAGLAQFVGDCSLPVPAAGAAAVNWSVERSADAARSGEWGLRLALPDAGGNATVWAERALRINATRSDVLVNVTFWTRADGAPTEAAAFVGLRSPYRLEQLTPLADGKTSIPGAQQLREELTADGEWRKLTLSGHVTTSSHGLLYVAIGFTRPAGGPATVDVDDVRIVVR